MTLRIGSGPQLGTALVMPGCPTITASDSSSTGNPVVLEVELDTSTLNPSENIAVTVHIEWVFNSSEVENIDATWEPQGIVALAESASDPGDTYDFTHVIPYDNPISLVVTANGQSDITVSVDLSATCSTDTPIGVGACGVYLLPPGAFTVTDAGDAGGGLEFVDVAQVPSTEPTRTSADRYMLEAQSTLFPGWMAFGDAPVSGEASLWGFPIGQFDHGDTLYFRSRLVNEEFYLDPDDPDGCYSVWIYSVPFLVP